VHQVTLQVPANRCSWLHFILVALCPSLLLLVLNESRMFGVKFYINYVGDQISFSSDDYSGNETLPIFSQTFCMYKHNHVKYKMSISKIRNNLDTSCMLGFFHNLTFQNSWCLKAGGNSKKAGILPVNDSYYSLLHYLLLPVLFCQQCNMFSRQKLVIS
jgi:hypothetical protein